LALISRDLGCDFPLGKVFKKVAFFKTLDSGGLKGLGLWACFAGFFPVIDRGLVGAATLNFGVSSATA
jgi:hypothetical protein